MVLSPFIYVSLQAIINHSCMRKRLRLAKRLRRLLILSLLATSVCAEAQQFVVADMESRVPIRDVFIHTNDNQNTQSKWDGTFSLKEGFTRINISHLNYEKRYVLTSELKGDTIWLMPRMNALREVVIYGERRFDNRMSQMMKTRGDQKLDAQWSRIKIPAGFNPLGFALWMYDLTFRKSVEERARRKKALKEVRKQEEEYEQRWDALEGKQEDEPNKLDK